MTTIVGSGDYTYECVEGWAKLPPGWGFKEIGAVGTELGCGLLILGVGLAGHILCRRHENRQRAGAADPVPAPVPTQPPGE